MSSKRDSEFTAWLDERESMLMAAARRICFDNQNADDVLQEALLDVYKRWAKVREHPNLDAYAIKVMVSKHADLRRKWARRQVEREISWEHVNGGISIGDRSDAIAEATSVQMALRNLSPSQRAVLTLTYEYMMPIKEVAEALDIPVGTVASQLARGREAVASYMELLPRLTAGPQPRALGSGEVIDAEVVLEGEEGTDDE
jgi:RNA polymerase sigma factor (sigma-70 family)